MRKVGNRRVNIGTKVKAQQDIGEGLQQRVPQGTEGVVTGKAFGGRIVVRFVLPGVFGGTRSVDVPVDPTQIVTV